MHIVLCLAIVLTIEIWIMGMHCVYYTHMKVELSNSKTCIWNNILFVRLDTSFFPLLFSRLDSCVCWKNIYKWHVIWGKAKGSAIAGAKQGKGWKDEVIRRLQLQERERNFLCAQVSSHPSMPCTKCTIHPLGRTKVSNLEETGGYQHSG